MHADADVAPVCDSHDGCITCGDEAVAVRVLELDAQEDLAVCVDGAGARAVVEVALVAPVAPGDSLLVHAGTAIARLEAA